MSQIKIASFILIVADQNCQFYPYCHHSKLAVLSLLWFLKKTSLIIIVPNKKCQFFFIVGIKIASFTFIVTDQNCQFCPYCHRSKLPVLSLLSKIKVASFIFIIKDQNCQIFPYCCSWKKVLLFFSPLKNGNLIIILIVHYKNCQFYLHCLRSKLPALPLLSQIKIASFILIVMDQNCQFYPYCHL